MPLAPLLFTQDDLWITMELGETKWRDPEDTTMMQAAGTLSMLLGLGFGLPCAFGIRHLAQTGEVWTFMGFPTYGNGPFERIGLHTSTALLLGFLAVCIAEVGVGAALLAGVSYAPAMSYALLPFELVFWIGFALPFGPLLGAARTGLLLL